MHAYVVPLLVFLLVACEAQTTNEITLQIVKEKEWTAAIQSHKGKVVVIDVWADFCLPCKKAFPHHVALHKKYAKDGVVCFSVAVDDVDHKDKVLKFLKSQGAAFPNYLLDVDVPTWQKVFDINGPPAAFVYDREGKLYQRFDYNDPDKQYTHEDVEKAVKKLLEMKQ